MADFTKGTGGIPGILKQDLDWIMLGRLSEAERVLVEKNKILTVLESRRAPRSSHKNPQDVGGRILTNDNFL